MCFLYALLWASMSIPPRIVLDWPNLNKKQWQNHKKVHAFRQFIYFLLQFWGNFTVAPCSTNKLLIILNIFAITKCLLIHLLVQLPCTIQPFHPTLPSPCFTNLTTSFFELYKLLVFASICQIKLSRENISKPKNKY